jgi:allantoin racemase
MKILVINPNTTGAITDAVLKAARGSAAKDTELVGVTAATGVATIASRTENLIAAQAMLELAAVHAHGYDALILGVSLDTALWPLRELLDIPVVGMTEAGIVYATLVSTRAGLLTYGLRMAPIYRELVAAYGMAARITAVAGVDLPPTAAFSDPVRVRRETLAAAQTMIDRDGAEALVLAGAAMAGLAAQLQTDLPVPVLDCSACAVLLAESLVRLKLPTPRAGSLMRPAPRAVSGVGTPLAALFEQTSRLPAFKRFP